MVAVIQDDKEANRLRERRGRVLNIHPKSRSFPPDHPPRVKRNPDKQPEPTFNHTGPVTIVTVLRSSALYCVLDVTRLYEGIKRNTSRPFRFVCFTDTPQWAFPDYIEVIPIKHPEWLSKHSKLEIFRMDLGRCFYLDLDTVIVGDIEPILSYSGKFAMLGDFSDPTYEYRGSGLMMWEPGYGKYLYQEFEMLTKEQREGMYPIGGGKGDQLFINRHMEDYPHQFQFMWPGYVVSYKLNVRKNRGMEDPRIVCFHGKPKLREIKDEWILQNWLGAATRRS